MKYKTTKIQNNLQDIILYLLSVGNFKINVYNFGQVKEKGIYL